jgi:hypothetical protein
MIPSGDAGRSGISERVANVAGWGDCGLAGLQLPAMARQGAAERLRSERCGAKMLKMLGLSTQPTRSAIALM